MTSLMAALGSLVLKPDLVQNIFQSGSFVSNKGVYVLKFYIRGKPWLVSVDDTLLVDTTQDPAQLVFSQPDPADSAIWAPIIEKGWAKVIGNYDLARKNNDIVNTMRAVSGAPVFSYMIAR